MRTVLKPVGQGVALLVIAGLLALLAWKVAFADDGGAAAQLAKGEHPTAPLFTLPRLDTDGSLALESLRGKAVVVNFWASWCPPCKTEAPALQRLYAKYRERGLVVVGLDQEDFKGDARTFVRRYGITFPVVHDRKKSMVGRYGVTGYPETYFVDRTGRLVGERITGPIVGKDNPERVERSVALALRPGRAAGS